jgi:hypothetical protein
MTATETWRVIDARAPADVLDALGRAISIVPPAPPPPSAAGGNALCRMMGKGWRGPDSNLTSRPGGPASRVHFRSRRNLILKV